MSAAGIPDHTSLVPKFQFGETIEQQEAELARNPLLERMRKSRNELASDPHRPLYHFVSPEGRLNDPNGLCFWQDNWHLFYQGYPPEDPRQHWGHAVSDDLIHWRDLPYSIHPVSSQPRFPNRATESCGGSPAAAAGVAPAVGAASGVRWEVSCRVHR